jgi:epoxyqueuosine reductase
VVLGNIGETADLPALEQAGKDEDPLIREHAVWAVNRIRNRASGKA